MIDEVALDVGASLEEVDHRSIVLPDTLDASVSSFDRVCACEVDMCGTCIPGISFRLLLTAFFASFLKLAQIYPTN